MRGLRGEEGGRVGEEGRRKRGIVGKGRGGILDKKGS